MNLNRRSFFANGALALLSRRVLPAQSPAPGPASQSTRADVAAIDHDRILAAADRYLTRPPAPLTSFPAPRSPGVPQDFYSESSDDKSATTPPAPAAATQAATATLFTAHSQALLTFSVEVAALTAAFVLTADARYADHATSHLRAWFIDPAHRMTPNLLYAQLTPGTTAPRFEGVLEAVHLAEVAQAISFLARSPSLSSQSLSSQSLSTQSVLTQPLSPEDLATIYAWFAAYLEWLGTARSALLARDQRNHHGTSWLLQAAACARLAPQPTGGTRRSQSAPAASTQLSAPSPPPNELTGLTALRHQFRTVTLRAQMVADGGFPREVSTALPYRNSLFNLDMLAGICDLLSTRFESAWEYELQDGPGMRVAIAHHFPFIANRGAWPYRADVNRFTELPLRQPSLLLAGRAYNRPEYVDLWKKLPADPADPVLLRTFPIRQPLLWVRRPPAL